MFSKQFIITGSHALKLHKLKEEKVVSTYFDILIIGPLYGISFGRINTPDKSGSKPASIFLEMMQPNIDKLMTVYRTTLFYHYSNLPLEERINRVFLTENSGNYELLENFEIYRKYLLGGIEKLFEDYDKFAKENPPKKYVEDSEDTSFAVDCMNGIITEFKKINIDCDIDISSLNEPSFR